MLGLVILDKLFGGYTSHFLPRGGEEPGAPRDSRRAALVGLIVTLLLVTGGVVLVHVLGRAARLQDCVMSGRTNCAPIDVSARGR
ncbi:MAG TPA: hypothetical protein VMU40_05475 [Steroidobacteraceae bacterium]|nr:hypothetical protein [Steroidobacteraceae bacterium]